jgi:ribosomal protein S18 acetylase RimI-like enzyme
MSGSAEPPEPLPLAPAGPDDHADIVALVNSAFRGAGGWNAETGLIEGARTTLDLLRADLEADPAAMLLIHRDAASGRLDACVRLSDKGGGIWHLGLLAVRPDLQARRLGRQMLEAAEAIIVRAGRSTVRIGVINLRDSLIAWYERRGYRRTGEEEPFPYGDQRFGTPLRDDLRFVVLEKSLG